MVRAPAIGWGVLFAAAGLATALPPNGQLTAAAAALTGIGLAHGAGDLAVVLRRRRVTFLKAYLVTAVVSLLAWIAWPAAAMPAFLLLSAAHFALEDGTQGRPIEAITRGVLLVAAPAVLHEAALARLLIEAGSVAGLASVLRGAGMIAVACSIGIAIRRRDVRLAVGIAALLALPPLIGFTVGFLLLHAVPQTIARRDRLGLATVGAYLRTVAPVLVAAVIGAALLVGPLRHAGIADTRILFAAIAAFAVPHMLVTPLFERPGRPAGQAASRSSMRSQISTSAPVNSRIIISSCAGPGVKRNRSVPRGTVG